MYTLKEVSKLSDKIYMASVILVVSETSIQEGLGIVETLNTPLTYRERNLLKKILEEFEISMRSKEQLR